MRQLSMLSRFGMAVGGAWLGTVVVTGALGGQTLPVGLTAMGTTSTNAVASFEFQATSAGILTAAVRSASETDLVLLVTDADGQVLPEGRSDQDLGGNAGAEQLVITLPHAGTYFVRVEPFGSGLGEFHIGASWLAFAQLEQPRDADGSPTSAGTLMVGEPLSDMIDGSTGDFWDWFSVRLEQGGLLTVATRAEEGDLILEAFNQGEYGEAMERSDQDLQGVAGNEAITITVTPGQTVYFKVSAFSAGTVISYRLTAGLIPD